MHVLICEVRCQMETLNAIKRILTSTYALDILCINSKAMWEVSVSVLSLTKTNSSKIFARRLSTIHRHTKASAARGKVLFHWVGHHLCTGRKPYTFEVPQIQWIWCESVDNSQLCKIVIHVEIMHCCQPESVHHIFRNKNMNQTPHNRPPLHLN